MSRIKFLVTAMAILTAQPYLMSQFSTTIQPGPSDGKDACIVNDSPTTNRGDVAHMYGWAGTSGGSSHIWRVLFDFDLAALPADAVIDTATLYLYHYPGLNNDYREANILHIEKITESWDEGTVTWNTEPSVSTVDRVTVPEITSAMEDIVVDITALVQDRWANPSTTYGFRLKQATETPYRGVRFCSSDHSDTSLRPKLVIKYQSVSEGGGSTGGGGDTTSLVGADEDWAFISGDSLADPIYRIGPVGIGSMNLGTHSLVVNGTIKSRDIHVTQSDWPDYVFEKDYELMPLKELEAYIRRQGHLPHIPPRSRVLQEGISLGDINHKLLTKIEELTLYIIELQKRSEEKDLRLQVLEEKMNR